jgi:hypothetical protein
MPQDGLWVINGKRQVIYTRVELSLRDQIYAARKLANESSKNEKISIMMEDSIGEISQVSENLFSPLHLSPSPSVFDLLNNLRQSFMRGPAGSERQKRYGENRFY